MPTQTSQKEEEYFARVEMDKRKKLEAERLKSIADDEKRMLREFHFMRCPKCGMGLGEIDYRGIKIDKCFSCNGVWFDGGELDALGTLDSPALNKLFRVFKK
jgi:hypothetical protein